MAGKTDTEQEPETKLARYLASAFIAYSHGIGMDYAHKKYAHMPVGPFWIEVARMVNAGTAQANEGVAFVVPTDEYNSCAHHNRKGLLNDRAGLLFLEAGKRE